MLATFSESMSVKRTKKGDLNKKILEDNNFSCIICSGFLWPPIMLELRGNLCGNCCTDEKPPWIRNKLLEGILENLVIPCSFSENGCKEENYYNYMCTHVKQCNFGSLNCPINEITPNCSWKSYSCKILDHFLEQHSSFIIRSETDSLSFPVLLSKNKDVKLIFIPSGVFLLLLSYDQDHSKMFCNLYYIVNYGSKSFDFCIEQTMNDNSLISCKTSKLKVPHILRYNNDKSSPSNFAEIDLSIFKGNLMNDTLKFTLKVQNKVFKGNNTIKAMLKIAECRICYEYMKSPIYQCSSGHSICCTCRKKSSCCPFCKSYFEKSRNYALEELINDLEFPCMYKKQGCTKLSTNEEKEHHELYCYFKIYSCPFKSENCDWSGRYDEYTLHIKSVHGYTSDTSVMDYCNEASADY